MVMANDILEDERQNQLITFNERSEYSSYVRKKKQRLQIVDITGLMFRRAQSAQVEHNFAKKEEGKGQKSGSPASRRNSAERQNA